MEVVLSEQRSDAPARSRILILLLATMVTFGIFYCDSITPLGFAHGTLYFAPLLMVSALGSPKLLYASVSVFALLSIAGYFMSPNGIDREIAAANRVASVAAMIVAVIVAARFRDRS